MQGERCWGCGVREVCLQEAGQESRRATQRQGQRVRAGPGGEQEPKRRGPHLWHLQVPRLGVHQPGRSTAVEFCGEPHGQSTASAAQRSSDGARRLTAQGVWGCHGGGRSTTWWAAGEREPLWIAGDSGEECEHSGLGPHAGIPMRFPGAWLAWPLAPETPRLPGLPCGGALLSKRMVTNSCPAFLVLACDQPTGDSWQALCWASSVEPGRKAGDRQHGHWAEAGSKNHGGVVGWGGAGLGGIGSRPVGCLLWERRGPEHSKEECIPRA